MFVCDDVTICIVGDDERDACPCCRTAASSPQHENTTEMKTTEFTHVSSELHVTHRSRFAPGDDMTRSSSVQVDFSGTRSPDMEALQPMSVPLQETLPASAGRLHSLSYDFQCIMSQSDAHGSDTYRPMLPEIYRGGECTAYGNMEIRQPGDLMSPTAQTHDVDIDAPGRLSIAQCEPDVDAFTMATGGSIEITDIVFDVLLPTSSPKSEAATAQGIRSMTLDEYRASQLEELKTESTFVRSMFINCAQAALRTAGVDATLCSELAEEIVIKGSKIKFNADIWEPANIEEIYTKYRYSAVKSYQCLLISAPHRISQWNPGGSCISLEQDRQERMEEMGNFCLQAFPPEHAGRNETESIFKFVEAHDRATVESQIREFFRQEDDRGIRGKNALHAVVVFFGHGSESGRGGFCLSADTPFNLDDINLLVRLEWKRAISRKPEELPAQVQIIFTQCYGHLHDRAVQCDRFRVIALTRSDAPRTTCIRDAEGRSQNVNLRRYVEGELQQDIERLERRRRDDSEKVEELVDVSTAVNRSMLNGDSAFSES